MALCFTSLSCCSSAASPKQNLTRHKDKMKIFSSRLVRKKCCFSMLHQFVGFTDTMTGMDVICGLWDLRGLVSSQTVDATRPSTSSRPPAANPHLKLIAQHCKAPGSNLQSLVSPPRVCLNSARSCFSPGALGPSCCAAPVFFAFTGPPGSDSPQK